MKAGTLEYNVRRHEFRGVNNTGRADAYLLNLLGVEDNGEFASGLTKALTEAVSVKESAEDIEEGEIRD